MKIEDRWWKKVDVRADGCWEWMGSRDRQGYGRISVQRIGRLAHRVGYEMLVGPVPSGLELDHLCRVRCCVNPQHLEPVTHAENVRRGMAGVMNNHNDRKTHCPYGHPLSGPNLLIASSGRKCRECMRARTRRWRASR